MSKLFEYASGRFVNPAKIITANIYSKQKGLNSEGQPVTEMRVAIDLDVKSPDKNCVYSDPMPSRDQAVSFISSIPVFEKD